MRISDWSSDVCSSDLPDRPLPVPVDRKDDADARRRLSPRLAAAPGQRAARLTPGKTAATSARRRTGTAVSASEAYRPTCRAMGAWGGTSPQGALRDRHPPHPEMVGTRPDRKSDGAG